MAVNRVAWLPDETADLIEEASQAVQRGAGEKLVALLLVGSGVQPMRHAGPHRPELLAVVSELPVVVLSNLAHQMRDVVNRGVRLQLWAKRELLRAADVFTLELADYQARNQLLCGRDPFGSVHFTKDELRRSIEQRLRRMVRDLRDAIFFEAAEANEAVCTETAIKAVEQLTVVAHHSLQLFGEEPKTTESELIAQLTAHAAVDAEELLGWVASARENPEQPRLASPMDRMRTLLSVLDAVTRLIDTYGA